MYNIECVVLDNILRLSVLLWKRTKMNQKQIYMFLRCRIIIILVFILSGCAAINDDSTGISERIKEMEGDKETGEDSSSIYNKETDFVLGEDDQPFFGDSYSIVKSDKGYYYLTPTGFLCFIDRNTKDNIYLCSKIDCSHSSKDCTAWQRGVKPELGMWFYHDDIYFVQNDEGDTYSLYCISGDGTRKEKVTDLFLFGSTYLDSAVHITLHRGFLYYSIKQADGSCILYRRDLEKPDTETVLYTEKGEAGSIIRIRGYGSKVFFEASHQEEENFQGNLYCYDTAKGEIALACTGIYKDYTIAGNQLLYSDVSEVWMVDLTSGEKREFYSPGYPTHISFDGTFFYFDNCREVMLGNLDMKDRCVSYFDRQGERQGEIQFTGVDPCAFGDEASFFYLAVVYHPEENTYYERFMMCDKGKMTEGVTEEIELLWN